MGRGAWAWGALAAGLLAACGDSTARPPGSGDAGSAGDGGSGADAGRLRLAWPEPTLTVEGATDPTLVRSPAGALTLVYQRDRKLFAHRDPPAGDPVELAALAGEVTLSAATSPAEDRTLLVWTGGQVLSLTGVQPDGPNFWALGGEAGLSVPSAGWIGGEPVVSAVTNEVWVGSQRTPARFLAFSPPIDAPRTLPAPAADQVIEDGAATFHHYDLQHPLLDLGEGRALVFQSSWASDPGDASGEGHFARWYLLRRQRDPADAPTGFWVPERSGYLALPGWAGWIQGHALGDGRFALGWGSSEGSQVYDVYLAPLAIAADGTPSLAGAPVNVSGTGGMTQNSDHALVRPSGDGRLWVAWRETELGPMVALLDGQSLRVLARGGPRQELGCDAASSLGAQVDAQGTLHLAAGFLVEGARRVHYFRIALP